VCLLVAIGGAEVLKAPFPWFGGKSRAAHLVWRGFGDVPNYVEPFAGSLAVLLGRPTAPRMETVNDLDCYLANFWRAVKWAPELVAEHADWPVNEADLHARHRDLVTRVEFRKRMKREARFFDAEIAGWWVWGLCQWIGSGWCASSNWDDQVRRSRGVNTAEEARRPNLHTSNGVHRRQIETAEVEGRPHLLRGKGVHRSNGSVEWEGRGAGGARAPRGVQTAESASGKRPILHNHGKGVNALQARRERDLAQASNWEKRPRLDGAGVHAQSMWEQLPSISGSRGATGRGVHASGMHEKVPKSDRGTDSRLQTSRGQLVGWMQALAHRLRRVRVCCGDWTRVLGRSSTESIGLTAVFLDPPYLGEAGRDPSLYSAEDLTVAADVRDWAIANGKNPKLRIALCGYEGEHDMPKSWECVEWKAMGGYAAAAGNHENAHRERIWFSPHCQLVEQQGDLFAAPPPRVA
jgi:site-specific DNA-adenine methylase